MKAAALAIEALRGFTAPGWRASCSASLFSGILKGAAPRGKRILSNLSMVYPDASEAWRRDMRRRVYENLAWTAAEILALQRDPAQALEWVEEVRNFHYIGDNLAAGRGIVIVSGHYGNWELFASWYAQYAAKKGFHDFRIVGRNTKDPDIAKLISQYRHNAGVRVISRSASALEMAKLLRAGGHIAALADISWPNGLILPFMGHPCTNTIGPAVLATLASVPIIPAAIYRTAPFRHVAEIFPPLTVPEEKNRRLKAELLTREVSAALERMIAPQPELWFWLHNRWKRGA